MNISELLNPVVADETSQISDTGIPASRNTSDSGNRPERSTKRVISGPPESQESNTQESTRSNAATTAGEVKSKWVTPASEATVTFRARPKHSMEEHDFVIATLPFEPSKTAGKGKDWADCCCRLPTKRNPRQLLVQLRLIDRKSNTSTHIRPSAADQNEEAFSSCGHVIESTVLSEKVEEWNRSHFNDIHSLQYWRDPNGESEQRGRFIVPVPPYERLECCHVKTGSTKNDIRKASYKTVTPNGDQSLHHLVPRSDQWSSCGRKTMGATDKEISEIMRKWNEGNVE